MTEAGWVQILLALVGGGILTGAANYLGARNRGREVWSEEGVRIRDELREHIDRLEDQIRQQDERITGLEKKLRAERTENAGLQAKLDTLTATNRRQAAQIDKLTVEVNRMRAEHGLPPITPDDL